MSFRTEEKIIIHQNQLKEFKSLILKNHGTKLYPKRKICSLYFDNPVLQMFADSEEGTVPRKKIRIRNYPEAKIMSYNLEKKISSVEGRFKKTKKINELDFNEFCKHGIYDNEYGSCLPKIWVQYYREYFQLYNQRITIDYKLEYKDFNSKVILHNQEDLIIEVKGDNKLNKDYFECLIPIRRSRFSKYSDGVKLINSANRNSFIPSQLG